MRPTLRDLERRVAESPDDLSHAYVHEGLGWHGQDLTRLQSLSEGGVHHVIPKAWGDGKGAIWGEQGVYEFVLRPTESIGATTGEHDDLMRMELVYVPSFVTPEARWRSWLDPVDKIVPGYYVGRFPVLWRDWRAFLNATHRDSGLFDENFVQRALADDDTHADQPVTYVTHDDANAFCRWAGLRLPDPFRWQVAALGKPSLKADPSGAPLDFLEWPRGAPWGDTPTTAEHCAAYDPRYNPPVPTLECEATDDVEAGDYVLAFPETGRARPGPQNPLNALGPEGPRPGVAVPGIATTHARRGEKVKVQVMSTGAGSRTAPVHEADGVTIARPKGSSWCGAVDMVGNVVERVVGGVCGWGFRGVGSSRLYTDVLTNHYDPADDLGFRVCLSERHGPPRP